MPEAVGANLPRMSPRPTPAEAPKGQRLYAIGDVHGRIDLLDELLRQILQDASAHETRHKALIYLGDYVDRGPASAAVLARVLDPLPGFDVTRLLGNHELMMRDALAGRTEWLDTWMSNGGGATLASYGIDDRAGIDGLRSLRHSMPTAHRRLLDGLASSHQAGDYFFVHAGVRPGVALGDQTVEDMAWIRKSFLLSDQDFGKTVVHGHSVAREVELRPNRIGIDTGAYFSGVLTALVLDGTSVKYLQTGR